MNCQHCNLEIKQGQYYAESDDDFKERLRSGYCRAKCKRLHTPARSERVKPPLELISHNVGRVETVAQEKDLPVRDQARLAFARSMPCFTCGAVEGIHAHHENEEGRGTMGGKTSDRRSIPLCPGCHRLRHETSRSFWGNVDVEAYIRDLNDAYDAYTRGSK